MTLLVAITVALAAVAVLAAIVIVAVGGGGELSTEHPDHPPLALPGRRAVGGTDAALLRLPLGLWGYHKQITDEALERFAYELTERDTRIAVLEQELAEARQGRDGGTHDRRLALPPARNDLPVMGGDPLATRMDRLSRSSVGDEEPHARRTGQAPEAPVTREEPLGKREGSAAGTDRTDRMDGADGADGHDDPASGNVYAPPTDPWRTVSDHRDDVEDEADVAERRPRKEDGE